MAYTYFKKICKISFAPFWSVLGGISAIFSLVVLAVGDDGPHIQSIAKLILILVGSLFLYRLLILAPYQLWKKAQAELQKLNQSERDPLKAKRKWLLDASSNLFTSAEKLCNQWNTSDAGQRASLSSKYRKDRERVLKLANSFLHEDRVYRAAQDAIQNCDIAISDAEEGLPSFENIKDARASIRILLGLLSARS